MKMHHLPPETVEQIMAKVQGVVDSGGFARIGTTRDRFLGHSTGLGCGREHRVCGDAAGSA